MRPLIAAVGLLLLAALPAPASAFPAPQGEDAAVGEPSLDDLTGSASYVIVTSSRFAREFERLARFRTDGGLTARVVTLRQIRRRFRAAEDDADRVRRFLRQAHDRWGTRWALIGAHDSEIPMRRARIHVGQLTIDLPTDQYYACLDGSWNADGDSLWGEADGDSVDLDPELFIGRAPVRTPREAAHFVENTIRAERTLALEDPRRVLLAAEVLPGIADLGGIAEGYRHFFEDGQREVLRLYENAGAWPGSQPESRAALLGALSTAPDLAVLFGAGGPTVFTAGDERRDVVTVRDAWSLRTCGGAMHLLFASASVLAPGSERSLGEAFLLAPRSEVATVIGPTGLTFVGTTNAYVRHVLESVMELGLPRAGEAMASAIRVLPGEASRLTTQGMQLLGDPALPLRGPTSVVARTARGAPLPDRDPLLPPDAAAWALAVPDPPSVVAIAAPSPGVRAAPATVASPRREPALRIASRHPARSLAEFSVELPDDDAGRTWSLAIYDLGGRRVRSLVTNGSGAGVQRVVWDLAGESGARVRPGLYFAQLRAGGQSRSRLVVVGD